MKKLNIMIIMQDMLRGGGEIHFVTLAKQLRSLGHNVVVVTSGGILVNELANSGIKHYKVPVGHETSILYYLMQKERSFGLLSILRDYLYVALWITKIDKSNEPVVLPGLVGIIFAVIQTVQIANREKIDIIHCSQNNPTLIAYLVSKITHIPFIAEVVGRFNYGDIFPPLGLKRIANEASYVIAISQEIKDDLITNHRVDPNKIKVIPNAVDIDKFSLFNMDDRVYYEKIIGVNHALKRVVCVGPAKFHAVKAIPKILDDVPGTQVIIVTYKKDGAGIDSIIKNINNKYNTQVAVSLHSVSDMEKLLSIAEVIIGVGQVALEAMACNKPVVIAGSYRGYLDGNYGGIITEDTIKELEEYNFSGRNSSELVSPDNIHNSVVKLLRNDALRSYLGTYGRSYVERKHDIKVIAKQIELLYLNSIKQ